MLSWKSLSFALKGLNYLAPCFLTSAFDNNQLPPTPLLPTLALPSVSNLPPKLVSAGKVFSNLHCSIPCAAVTKWFYFLPLGPWWDSLPGSLVCGQSHGPLWPVGYKRSLLAPSSQVQRRDLLQPGQQQRARMVAALESMSLGKDVPEQSPQTARCGPRDSARNKRHFTPLKF